MKKISLKILTALFLLVCQFASAQVNVQNTGVLYLSVSTDTFYVNGGFTNATTSTLTNNGNLYVKQTLTNDQSSMATGTGTLYLNGSSAQSVAGAQPFLTNNLVTNNAAGITLNNNLSVAGVHTFTAGIINSSATPNYLVYQAGSSYSGDGDANHVHGWVQKVGTTSFTFPLGNGVVERTINMSGLSGASVFNANYAGVTTNINNLLTPLVAVNPHEYWVLNQVSGGSATINMNWNYSKVPMANYLVTDMRASNYLAGNWTSVGSTGGTGTQFTTGTISTNSISSFGSFVIGSISVALSVTLVQFNVSRSKGVSDLSWTVNNESNLSGYQPERSDDGINFYALGTVPAGNQSGILQYTFQDTKPLNKVAYYRIRSVGEDGQTGYSKIIAVNDRQVAADYFTVNNPAHGSINLTAGSNHTGAYNYYIRTLNGQLVQQGQLNIVHGGNYSIALNGSIPNALYILEVSNKDFHYQNKILVQ